MLLKLGRVVASLCYNVHLTGARTSTQFDNYQLNQNSKLVNYSTKRYPNKILSYYTYGAPVAIFKMRLLYHFINCFKWPLV